MSDKILLEKANEIGPEVMVYVYDPENGMKGLVVIDSTAAGTAGGGTRMVADLTADEVFALARAMTYKFAILGFPRGGCKGGIWGDPMMPKEQKKNIMKSFGKALRPYLESGILGLGTDMGVNDADVRNIYEGAGITRPGKRDLFSQICDGEPLGEHFTGFGVVCAMKAASKIAKRELKQARVAIEGFGKVGGVLSGIV